MRLNRNALLGGVAAIALGGFTVATISTAEAYDNKSWSWTLNTNTNIEERVTIDITIDPIGKILDEVMQIQVGDVKAKSEIHDIYNWKPLEEVSFKTGYKTNYKLTVDGDYEKTHGGYGVLGGFYKYGASETQSWEKTLNGSLVTEGEGIPFFIGGAGAIGGFFVSPGPSGAAGAGVIGAIGAYATDGNASFDAALGGSTTYGVEGDGYLVAGYGYYDKQFGTFNANLDVTESVITTIYTLAPAMQDALKELPKVESVATAVGNLVSIESDTAVQESSLQVLFDDVDDDGRVNFEDADFDLDADLSLQDQKYDLNSGNYNHDVALLLGLAAGAGLIEQADVTAESNAYSIYNAQVTSSATAIGNLKSISVETGIDDNGLVIADITQLSVANVSADAKAQDIHLINYTNLGKLTDPIASATATAIGNAVNISVNSNQGLPTQN